MISVINGNKYHYSSYKVNYKTLVKLMKKVSKMKKYWDKKGVEASFVHLNPELTFFVNYKK